MVCGGAAKTYVDCDRTRFSQTCQRNVECITTAGGAEWCSGPKMKECYVYNPFITETFQPVFKVFSNQILRSNFITTIFFS